MSVNITFDGQPYIVPETGEVGWGGNTTSYLVAIAAGALQKTGGSFTLSAETDFGADFGLQSLYYKSRTASIAAAGILRLANNSDNITWRNAANNADLSLLVNASDQLTYETDPILTGTGPSAYVASATGTANQVIASASTGAVTFSLPQNIDTSAAVQFGVLGLGSAVVASSILSLTSTTLGFLPPRMDTTARDNISTPATGLFIYNTSTGTNDYFNGSIWVALAAGGTINAGTQFQLGYYAAGGTTISGLTLITASRALVSDANGLPIAATTTTAELQALAGLTASRALQTDGSGLVSPSAVTATELAFVSGVTSAIQTQIDSKAADSLVVHLAGTETITGAKTFQDSTLLLQEISSTDVVTIAVAALAASRIYTMPDVGASASFVMTAGSQTINGSKTFGSSISAPAIINTGGVDIEGTNTNDAAASGFVGEEIRSNVADSSGVSMTGTNQYTDITSISLTAGDWDVSIIGGFTANGATITEVRLGTSSTAGNSATGLVFGDSLIATSAIPNASTDSSASIASLRVSLSSTTTYYLKIRMSFSVATPQGYGRISARRVR